MPQRRGRKSIESHLASNATRDLVAEEQTQFFKCRYCKVQFPSELNRNYHEKQRFCRLYSNENKSFETSSRSRSTSSNSKSFHKAAATEAIEIFKCSECKEYIDGKNEFTYHLDMKCISGEREDENLDSLETKEKKVGSKGSENSDDSDGLEDEEEDIDESDYSNGDEDQDYPEESNDEDEEVEIYGLNGGGNGLRRQIDQRQVKGPKRIEQKTKRSSVKETKRRNSVASSLTNQSMNLDGQNITVNFKKSIKRRRSKDEGIEDERNLHTSEEEEKFSFDIEKEKLNFFNAENNEEIISFAKQIKESIFTYIVKSSSKLKLLDNVHFDRTAMQYTYKHVAREKQAYYNPDSSTEDDESHASKNHRSSKCNREDWKALMKKYIEKRKKDINQRLNTKKTKGKEPSTKGKSIRSVYEFESDDAYLRESKNIFRLPDLDERNEYQLDLLMRILGTDHQKGKRGNQHIGEQISSFFKDQRIPMAHLQDHKTKLLRSTEQIEQQFLDGDNDTSVIELTSASEFSTSDEENMEIENKSNSASAMNESNSKLRLKCVSQHSLDKLGFYKDIVGDFFWEEEEEKLAQMIIKENDSDAERDPKDCKEKDTVKKTRNLSSKDELNGLVKPARNNFLKALKKKTFLSEHEIESLKERIKLDRRIQSRHILKWLRHHTRYGILSSLYSEKLFAEPTDDYIQLKGREMHGTLAYHQYPLKSRKYMEMEENLSLCNELKAWLFENLAIPVIDTIAIEHVIKGSSPELNLKEKLMRLHDSSPHSVHDWAKRYDLLDFLPQNPVDVKIYVNGSSSEDQTNGKSPENTSTQRKMKEYVHTESLGNILKKHMGKGQPSDSGSTEELSVSLPPFTSVKIIEKELRDVRKVSFLSTKRRLKDKKTKIAPILKFRVSTVFNAGGTITSFDVTPIAHPPFFHERSKNLDFFPKSNTRVGNDMRWNRTVIIATNGFLDGKEGMFGPNEDTKNNRRNDIASSENKGNCFGILQVYLAHRHVAKKSLSENSFSTKLKSDSWKKPRIDKRISNMLGAIPHSFGTIHVLQWAPRVFMKVLLRESFLRFMIYKFQMKNLYSQQRTPLKEPDKVMEDANYKPILGVLALGCDDGHLRLMAIPCLNDNKVVSDSKGEKTKYEYRNFDDVPLIPHHILYVSPNLEAPVSCLAWSPFNPKLLLVGTFGGLIYLFSLESDSIKSLSDHRDKLKFEMEISKIFCYRQKFYSSYCNSIRSVSWCPVKEDIFAVTSLNGGIQIWSFEDTEGPILETDEDDFSWSTTLQWLRTGNGMVYGSIKGDVNFIALPESGNSKYSLYEHRKSYEFDSVSAMDSVRLPPPNGEHLFISGGVDGSVRLLKQKAKDLHQSSKINAASREFIITQVSEIPPFDLLPSIMEDQRANKRKNDKIEDHNESLMTNSKRLCLFTESNLIEEENKETNEKEIQKIFYDKAFTIYLEPDKERSLNFNYPLREMHLDLRYPTEKDLWYDTRRAALEKKLQMYKQGKKNENALSKQVAMINKQHSGFSFWRRIQQVKVAKTYDYHDNDYYFLNDLFHRRLKWKLLQSKWKLDEDFAMNDILPLFELNVSTEVDLENNYDVFGERFSVYSASASGLLTAVEIKEDYIPTNQY